MNDKEILYERPYAEENPKWCIFEMKVCRYANKDGNAFNCTAPSDDEMTCR